MSDPAFEFESFKPALVEALDAKYYAALSSWGDDKNKTIAPRKIDESYGGYEAFALECEALPCSKHGGWLIICKPDINTPDPLVITDIETGHQRSLEYIIAGVFKPNADIKTFEDLMIGDRASKYATYVLDDGTMLNSGEHDLSEHEDDFITQVNDSKIAELPGWMQNGS